MSSQQISQNISQDSAVLEDVTAMTSESVNVDSQISNCPRINLSSSDSDSSSSDSDSSSSDSESSSSDSDSSSSDSDNSSSSDSDDSVKDISSAIEHERTERKYRNHYYMPEVCPDETVGEYYGLNPNIKLPDIASLSLNDEEEFVLMGHIESIIDRIVSVAPLPTFPVFDLDTLLFLEEGKRVLGYVIDVVGEISNPLYVLPLPHSPEKSDNPKIEIGKEVYCAPNSSLTKCVNVAALLLERGCDASGEGDREIPPELRQDFSNDEEEQEFLKKQHSKKRKQGRQKARKYMHPFDPSVPPPSLFLPPPHLPPPLFNPALPPPYLSLPHYNPAFPPPNLSNTK